MIVYTNRYKIPFQIDKDDWVIVSHYSWFIDGDGYPRTTIGTKPNQQSVRLHVLLLGKAPNGLEWDHINRNKLDNRRENFRAITHIENMRNKSAYSNNTSGVTGVCWRADRSQWQVRINVSKSTRMTVGWFEKLEDAKEARRMAEAFYYDSEGWSNQL